MVQAEAKHTWTAMGAGALESYQAMAAEKEAANQAAVGEAKKATRSKEQNKCQPAPSKTIDEDILEDSAASERSGAAAVGSVFAPRGEPMPEFILIQREKKDVVRKLIVRAATMNFIKESVAFTRI